MTTTHAHRAPSRPFDLRAHARGAATAPPEALLVLSALLVVLAGPLASALAPEVGWVAAVSALLLATGVGLAVLATLRLVRRGA